MQSDKPMDNAISHNTPLKEVIDSLDRTTDIIRLSKQLEYLKRIRSQYAAQAELVTDMPEQVGKGR